MPPKRTSGQVAYEAYVESSGGVSAGSGAKLPTWDEQSADIKVHWEAAADAVLRDALLVGDLP